MSTPALLLLMHQGNSFVEEANAVAGRLGLKLVALSSAPASAEVFEKNQAHLTDWIVTAEPRLAASDVAAACDSFAGRGYALRACVATFEGYRVLMAELNHRLGVRETSIEALRRCLDKFQLRQFLYQHELSAVPSHRLNLTETPDLDPSRTWFIKPVRGTSSFGCFILKDAADLKDLAAIQAQMKRDHKMVAIFMEQYDFLAEEYIEGPEFSFEIIVVDGESFPICVHEKARVERHERTTLEAMSISPPVSLDRDTVLAGVDYVSRCFQAVGLTAGAFHVEAKYWTSRRRWEIIEINPRMGGSLINASVKAVTGGSILDLWIRSLLLPADALDGLSAELRQVSQVEAMRRGLPSKATIFVSKYGEKGRTVTSIEFVPEPRAPEVLKMHVEKGTALEDSDRAIVLMDALWQVDCANLEKEIAFIDDMVGRQFKVQYQ